MKFDAKQQQALSQEQLDELYSIDAVYCNKFYVSTQGDGMVRIVFADADPNETVVRARFSVAIPVHSYVLFAQLIKGNEQNAYKIIEAMQQKPAPYTTNNDKPESIQ